MQGGIWADEQEAMMGQQLPGIDMLKGSGSQLGTISGYNSGCRGAIGI